MEGGKGPVKRAHNQSTARLALQRKFQDAQSLVGAEVKWASDAMGTGERMKVLSATSDGMVSVTGHVGVFAPHLFRRIFS